MTNTTDVGVDAVLSADVDDAPMRRRHYTPRPPPGVTATKEYAVEELCEADVTDGNSLTFGLSCILLAGSMALSAEQAREPSGVRGLPVEGHDIVAGVEIVGTKQIDVRRIRERLRANGADLRLGLPLEPQTLCRFKEVLRDVMSEKGFVDAELTHDTRPTYGNPQHMTIELTVVEGKRSRPVASRARLLSPAQRCSR